mmetsp:Transcript_48184/g.96089  ORF Transcript_48184/g.96089 Transcript_48184/m.96089 type:complete len:534 (-) Transcript_48184:236-1837(-)
MVKHSAAKLLSASEGTAKMSASEKERLKRYDRGPANKAKGVVKHRLKLGIKRSEKKIASAATKAAQAEVLLPTEAGVLEAEGEMERTARFTQRQVSQAVDQQTARKAYNMTLDRFGPYRACYTPNGKHLLLGGRKGHLAILDWEKCRITREIHVRETVRDVTFFRDHTMFAAAQHKNLYIYDGDGTELHCLRDHKPQVNRVGFLRYHWLLATVGSTGHLRYLDVSTGTNVADLHTRLGECDCMRLNPWNALVHLGHRNGTVTLWTPNMNEPVVKMLTHKGPVAAIAVDRSGHYMATSGRDGQLKVWDVRTYRPMHSYNTPRPATDLDISDRGMLAAVHGPSVQVFKDGLARRTNGPYMTHLLPSCECETARFCPYEDLLGLGHSKGFCSMLVPGAGEPNFDSFEANPYETTKQRREAEVVSLLEKLPPSTIMLDPTRINTVDRNQKERQHEAKVAHDARLAELAANKKVKKKTRGRSKAARKVAKKQSNVIDEKRRERQEQLAERRKQIARRSGPAQEDEGFNPLARFGSGAS